MLLSRVLGLRICPWTTNSAAHYFDFAAKILFFLFEAACRQSYFLRLRQLGQRRMATQAEREAGGGIVRIQSLIAHFRPLLLNTLSKSESPL